FRAIFLRANIVNGHNWHDPYYEPLWSALEDLEVPLGFHEANNSAARQVGEQFGHDFMLRHTFSHPVEQMLAVGSFCGGGVLDRHPKLRVAFLEGNCGWLPFLMWRLDEHWELYGDQWAPALKNPPSHYFKRQCYASVECDEEPAKYAIDFLGNERLVFSTDFPHVDTKYPRAGLDVEYIQMRSAIGPQAVLNGNINFFTSPQAAINAAVAGLPLVVVLSLYRDTPWVLVTTKDISRAENLIGKKIAISDIR